jgi:ABC-type branched-subunit amino acid transport system permease subunit
VLPADARTFGKIAFVLLVGAVLGLTLISGVWQKLALIPTLYLATVAWENLLVKEPSVTRLILVGVMLIVLMNARPQGLLGTARVEIA